MPSPIQTPQKTGSIPSTPDIVANIQDRIKARLQKEPFYTISRKEKKTPLKKRIVSRKENVKDLVCERVMAFKD
jgi:hypothetical protein